MTDTQATPTKRGKFQELQTMLAAEFKAGPARSLLAYAGLIALIGSGIYSTWKAVLSISPGADVIGQYVIA